MGKKKLGRILATGAAAAAAGVAAKKVYDTKKKKDEIQKEAVEEAVMKRRDYTGRTAHFIGGGLASLAGAAYLIRDCKFPGSQITVYEGNAYSGRQQ